MQYEIFHSILILLVVAVVFVGLFRRLKLPPILAYLLIGIILGPFGTAVIADTEATRFLAEFGVVFMLFSIGLEFSLAQLLAMKGIVFGLGGLQVLITTVVSSMIAIYLGVTVEGAIVIGGVVAMSSTAIVTKQLSEQLEQHSRHGRQSIGILIFQDLAVVPFLALIPILASNSDNIMLSLLLVLVEAAAVLVIVLAIGYWLLRPLFHEITKTHSAELFTLTVLLVTLSAAWTTHSAGLSFALGAFLAGMMLSETEFRHQIEADIRPFRDVLLGLFFITVGMLLDISIVSLLWPWVLMVTLGLVLFKFALVYLLSIGFGSIPGVAVRTAVVIAHGGEFGFALLALALSKNVLENVAGQVMLASVVLSMILAPFVIYFNGRIAKFLCSTSYGSNRAQMVNDIASTTQGMEGHVIICGYGRIGQSIARFLVKEGFSYIAADLDPVRVREARTAGDVVNYGDTTRKEILEAAGLERARLLVVTYDNSQSAEKVLAQVQQLNAELPVLVRTGDDRHLEELKQAGATEVVPETLEASLMLAAHMLLLLGITSRRINQLIREARSDRYQLMRGFFVGEEGDLLGDATLSRFHLAPVKLLPAAFAVGKNLGELKLEECGVRINAVRRSGIRGEQPTEETHFREGDVLILYGTTDAIAKAESRLLSGR